MDKQAAMVTGEVADNRCAAPDHFLMTVRLPLSFPTPDPGQFVMVREAGRQEPLLARPFSIFDFYRRGDEVALEVLYRVAGRGTTLLSRLKPGDGLTLLGPLGKGFGIPDGIKRGVFVAGGVGVAPLHFLIHRRFPATTGGSGREAVFYFGARSQDLLAGIERLRGSCDLRVCTDDGSQGYRGLVTERLKGDMDAYDPGETVIFACGPLPMLRALKRLLGHHPIPCQASLEERMACGIGACLGCAIAIRGPGGKREYRKVCQDGPVFDLQEVLPGVSVGPKGDDHDCAV